MAKTKTITVIQEVLVPHNETIWRTWYAVVQRTIEREIDTAGNIIREEQLDGDSLIEGGLKFEETIESDTDLEAEDILSEEFEDDESASRSSATMSTALGLR